MNKEQPRNILFFLSPRFVDFDTYLPTAMELAEARPEWRIRFVIFHEQNYRAILANYTTMTGLGRCSSIHYLGSGDSKGIGKLWRRLSGLAVIAGWILRHARPVLFSSRAFSRAPYSLFAALARLRSGNSYLLWKKRSSDELHRIRWQILDMPEKEPISLLARMLGRDQDAVIHYHDQQQENLGEASAFGRVHDVPWLRIGMPNYFRSWRRFIEEQAEVERERLVRQGIPRDAEIYTVFTSKPGSDDNVGQPGSVGPTFRTIITTLARLRPGAVILVRAHPQAMEAPYIREGIEAAGGERIYMSLTHPEVLFALSRRCVSFSVSNMLFSGYSGHFMDCCQYPDFHFREHGEVSLAHGYGPLYVNPLGEDFASRFARALEDDSLFDAPELTNKMNALQRDNPPRFEVLLDLLDRGHVPQNSPLTAERRDLAAKASQANTNAESEA
ncbi:MAG: hypothetical protein QGH32_08965 [Alphaproteobacteria bacterium]|jgi:hypothetical protein|nr:hypothetical protein [Alphaproteobacteria bacterium]